MGYFRHDAIVITGAREHVEKAAEKAMALGLPVSSAVRGLVNDEWAVLVAPDFSKEGWATSSKADQARYFLKIWLKENEEMYLDFVHISFGGDEPELTHIVDFNGKE